MCGHCKVPKRGHICPFQPTLKKSFKIDTTTVKNSGAQAEFDPEMCIRALGNKLAEQGIPDSYAS